MNILKTIIFLSCAVFAIGCMENESLMSPVGVMVSEDVEIGTTIAQIIERNGKMDIYTIVDGDEQGNFIITNSGEVITNKELNFKKCSTYDLEIETETHKHVHISVDIRKLG